MVDHPILLAVTVGVSYLLIWGIYRLARRYEYHRYDGIHQPEHEVRAKADYAINDARVTGDDRHRLELERDEKRRRAKWDAKHGPLMAPMDLSNREESRWPIGTAFQGATAVTVSLLIAGLIWSGPGHRPVPEPEPTVYATPPTGVSVPASVFIAGILAVAGVVLLCVPSWKGRLAGGLCLALSLLSGAKILPVEKIFSLEDITLLSYTRNHSPPPNGYSFQTLSVAVENMVVSKFPWGKMVEPRPQPPPPFFHSITLPPFESGSAEPDQHLCCALRTLARHLAEDPHLSSIIVVGRADRRELRPTARRKYATNWGLAQQRAACVERVLRAMHVKPENMLVITAGPLLTSHSMPAAALDPDRTVTLLITGSGSTREHSWVEAIERNAGQWDCNNAAEVPLELCRGPSMLRNGM
jgi:hypothetical protein